MDLGGPKFAIGSAYTEEPKDAYVVCMYIHPTTVKVRNCKLFLTPKTSVFFGIIYLFLRPAAKER